MGGWGQILIPIFVSPTVCRIFTNLVLHFSDKVLELLYCLEKGTFLKKRPFTVLWFCLYSIDMKHIWWLKARLKKQIFTNCVCFANTYEQEKERLLFKMFNHTTSFYRTWVCRVLAFSQIGQTIFQENITYCASFKEISANWLTFFVPAKVDYNNLATLAK